MFPEQHPLDICDFFTNHSIAGQALSDGSFNGTPLLLRSIGLADDPVVADVIALEHRADSQRGEGASFLGNAVSRSVWFQIRETTRHVNTCKAAKLVDGGAGVRVAAFLGIVLSTDRMYPAGD